MCGAVRCVPHYLNAHILNAEMQQDFLVESQSKWSGSILSPDLVNIPS